MTAKELLAIRTLADAERYVESHALFCPGCGPGAPGHIELPNGGDYLTPPDRITCPVCVDPQPYPAMPEAH